MIKLAIVSPCYNEEEVLEQSAARLTSLFDELVGKEKISADSFVLFVNDGSKDRTWNIIKKLHKENPYVKGMNLAAERRSPERYHGRDDDCQRLE